MLSKEISTVVSNSVLSVEVGTTLKELALNIVHRNACELSIENNSKQLYSLFSKEFIEKKKQYNNNREMALAVVPELMNRMIKDSKLSGDVTKELLDIVNTIKQVFVKGYNVNIKTIPFSLLKRIVKCELDTNTKFDKLSIEEIEALCIAKEYSQIKGKLQDIKVKLSDDVVSFLDKLDSETLKAVNQYISTKNKVDKGA